MSDNRYALYGFIGVVAITLSLMIAVVATTFYSAGYVPVEPLPMGSTATAGGPAAKPASRPPSSPAAVGASAGVRRADSPPAAAPGVLRARKVAQLPDLDPTAGAWEGVPATEVALLPQTIAMPTLDTATGRVIVQSMTDGKEIAWRLIWADPAADMNVDADRFTDAVAMQFPLTPNAAFTMGVRGMKVQIVHWKAIWQKDIDERFQDVQDLHPNYWTDFYWFAEPVSTVEPGRVRYRVPESFADERSHAWFPGHAAGNPHSVFHRETPVEELVAEGFGTLTHQPDSVTTGRGVWRDGHWFVVFRRPLTTQDKLDYQFSRGATHQFAVAVWEGGAGHVGARKQWSAWANFEIER